MSKGIYKLTTPDSKSILRESKLGRLGCIADEWPYVVPVNYFFDGEDIYLHSLPGKKINALRRNTRVCFQVDTITNPYQWRSVIAYGNYEEICDRETRENTLNKLLNRFPQLTPVESIENDEFKPVVVFCIKVDDITGIGEDL